MEKDGDKNKVSLIQAYPVVEGTGAVIVDSQQEGDRPRTYTVRVGEASKTSRGVITEDRVRELVPEVAAYAPLRVTARTPEEVSINVLTTHGAEYSQATDNTGADVSLLPSGGFGKSFADSMRIGALPADNVRENVVPQGGVLVQAGYTSERSIEELSEEELSAGERTSYHSGVWVGVAAGQGLEIGDYDSGEKGRLRAKTATEEEAGIISEARVKELAGTVTPSLSAKSPLKLEDGELSAIPYPDVEGVGPVTVNARSAQLPGGAQTGMTFSVGVNPATENEAGVITEARVKELIAEAIATALAQNPTE